MIYTVRRIKTTATINSTKTKYQGQVKNTSNLDLNEVLLTIQCSIREDLQQKDYQYALTLELAQHNLSL